MNPLETPVVLLIFNRPELTIRVMDSIRRVQPRRLWVVADGPRTDRPSDARLVAEVRQLVERGIDWPCELKRVYSADNLGCALRVSSGLNAVFAEESRAIILEDDCLPDITFFRFCEELLDHHAENRRVAAISGDNFLGGLTTCGNSYYYSRFPHCWGWATWRRAWCDYDHSMTGWPDQIPGSWLASRTSTPAEYRYWRHAFDSTLKGTMDSWANRWTYTCWRRDWMTILPRRNLVSNIGFGNEATHTKGQTVAAALETTPMEFPLRHPPDTSTDSVADRSTARMLFSRSRLPMRISRRGIVRLRGLVSKMR